MKKETRAKLARETRELNLHQLPSTRRHVVVSPTVTRRPKLDSMLGKMALVSEHILEQLAQKALNDQAYTKDEVSRFTEIANTVIRQTRAEMEVEKHVEARSKRESDEEITLSITQKLMERGIESGTIEVVLKELGLQ